MTLTQPNLSHKIVLMFNLDIEMKNYSLSSLMYLRLFSKKSKNSYFNEFAIFSFKNLRFEIKNYTNLYMTDMVFFKYDSKRFQNFQKFSNTLL